VGNWSVAPGVGLFAQRTAAVTDEAMMAARLARDLPPWLHRTVTLGEARDRVRRRLAERPARLLRLARRAVYGNPGSPYLRLLRHAGCELGDFEQLVASHGVEGTLATLAASGVYVTFDELKGRSLAVRGSARFAFSPAAFDNPSISPHFVEYTGGTGGTPAVVMRTLGLVEEIGDEIGVMLRAHGLERARHLFWLSNPVFQYLYYLKLGQRDVRWYHPLPWFPFKARLGARYLAVLGCLAGRPLPIPRYLDAGQPERLLAMLHRRPRDGRPLVLTTLVSMGVRVAMGARAAGVDLNGVTFRLQSEPLTEARHRHLTSVGAGVIHNYALTELPALGISCARARSADDLHFFSDRHAVIERTRPVAAGGATVDALLFTTLSEHAPKIFLNAEPGDVAQIDRRECGCALGTVGLTTHLSQIRSFEKLSAEGVSFARSNLLEVLEQVLPSRFGGTSLDYQLAEEEGADGAARLILRVDPVVGRIDADALRATFLAELGRGGMMDRHHAELLRRAGSVTVRREPPLATAAGKVLPFQPLRRASSTTPDGSAPGP